MKSIKPGRGPSRMGMVGSIFAAIFGVFWCIMAASIGAGVMVPFGLIFIGLAVYSAIYNYRNATGKNRYSLFDIVDAGEEEDPLNEQIARHVNTGTPDTGIAFCPYCGFSINSDFEYCPKCGKKLPF